MVQCGCLTAVYCSARCRRVHWPAHRDECPALEAGRTCQASRSEDRPPAGKQASQRVSVAVTRALDKAREEHGDVRLEHAKQQVREWLQASSPPKPARSERAEDLRAENDLLRSELSHLAPFLFVHTAVFHSPRVAHRDTGPQQRGSASLGTTNPLCPPERERPHTQ
eukprot:TRINITY_DN6757_c0_g1_i6.p3 TRINITY_DN6757_c0_g1~~TRINITY_DN6757_c0_g1_i6.p3  ORF type:complete len:167 (+),score=45.31 TRINITY_DN6757_c0_g1_i6:603-1103(+)